MDLTFYIPSEAVPACIGYGGMKLRDTEDRTKTRIRFADRSDVMTLVSIQGPPTNCDLAKTLINMAVGHCLASLREPSPCLEILDKTHAVFDIRAVLFEMYRT